MPSATQGSPAPSTTHATSEVQTNTKTSLAAMVGAIFVPLAVAFVGGWFAGAAKNREVEGKFVELAVAILREPPDPQKKALREWSIDVLNSYSGAPIPPDARRSLSESSSLPGASAAVRDVQHMLAALGYFRGTVDGVTTPLLREAVSNFQKANNATPDGIMNSATVNLLIQQYSKRAPAVVSQQGAQ